MDQEIIRTINQEVYRKFPEFNGKKPKIELRKTPKSGDVSELTYLLIYQMRVTTADNKSMSRYVRVVITEQGKIIKISTSR